MAVGRAFQREAVAGKALVHGGDQAGYIVVAVATHHRVDVAGVGREAVGHQAAAAAGVGLVPGGQLARGNVGGGGGKGVGDSVMALSNWWIEGVDVFDGIRFWRSPRPGSMTSEVMAYQLSGFTR